MNQILDAKRRELWGKMGEPEHAALSEEEKELPPSEQERLFRAMREEEAAAQAEWEQRPRS